MALERHRRLLRVEELARQLGISRSKIYEELAAGRLRSVQIGRARRFPIEEIENYLNLLRVEAREEGRWPDREDDPSSETGGQR